MWDVSPRELNKWLGAAFAHRKTFAAHSALQVIIYDYTP